ncbi:MAG TPA: hypothetical protein VN709_04325 [Terriglobales bacterium]|nr:hypothetical protein [Terriglobales bacterium]
MRKKRSRYKLVTPTATEPQIPARVLNTVTIVQWAIWGGLIGILVAFLLIASLYTQLHISQRYWLTLWPASIRLMTATGLSAKQMTHLAFWMAGENGLIYGMIGIILGAVHVTLRTLRRRWA